MSNKIVVQIDRSKWRSGDNGLYRTGTGLTELLNDSGCMCCLGFITKAVCPALSILRVPDPSAAAASIPDLNVLSLGCSTGVGYVNTRLANKAIEINDANQLPVAEKEQKLIELFKDSMYALEFVGEYSVSDIKEKA